MLYDAHFVIISCQVGIVHKCLTLLMAQNHIAKEYIYSSNTTCIKACAEIINTGMHVGYHPGLKILLPPPFIFS